ncbi:hypothetical protein GGP43_003274 [Salinibacter ruber]|nr:hypothetical protein [Salinibacter ruber]
MLVCTIGCVSFVRVPSSCSCGSVVPGSWSFLFIPSPFLCPPPRATPITRFQILSVFTLWRVPCIAGVVKRVLFFRQRWVLV